LIPSKCWFEGNIFGSLQKDKGWFEGNKRSLWFPSEG
jgi:hypothetical protein